MKSAPPRQNEAAALSALHLLGVLDTEAEAEFDAIVLAASTVCGTPISLISLVDTDRQWFKANVGLPGAIQTPREWAFCAHAVLDAALFEVPNALEDERFSDNPLVASDPNIRFYAGVPIKASGGEHIGTLCVIDRQPRQLNAVQREILQNLGVVVGKALQGRRAMRVIEASEMRTRRMYESTPAMLHSVDKQNRLIAVSDLWLAKLGYERDEVIGRLASDLLTPESLALSALSRPFAEGRVDQVECQIQTRDKRTMEVLLSAIVEYDANGLPLTSLSVMEDVTERRRVERALQKTRRDQQNILDAVPSMIGYWDRHLINHVANKAYTDWFGIGIGIDSIQGTHMRALLGDELFERNQSYIDAVLQGEPQTFERSISRRDGKAVRHSLTHYLPDVVDGEVQGFYVLVHDISELVEGRLKLAAAQRDSEALVGTLNQHAIVSRTDRDGRIIEVNDALCAISGYTREELLGQNYRLLNNEGHFREFWSDVWCTIERGQTWRGEVCNRAKDGSLYWESRVVAPFFGADGQIEQYIFICNDITPIKHAVDTAEAANRAKSQFLANMSHEIRTPMNAVIGLCYLLERMSLTSEQADTLGKIKLASNSLLSIINDVLDLSKIEATEMHLECAPFLLDGLLSELVALSQVQADAKGVSFSVQTSDLPQAVEGDATRLRQVLTNLLTNAIKFTQHGQVQLSVELLSTEAGQVRLRFVVKDSGIGIPPEVLERLFTPFVQADTSMTRRFGGTGLGLSIVKQLVTLMGGEIGVNSTPQVGSEFWVELGFAVCDKDAVQALADVATSATGPGLLGVRVLVTDDNPMNLEVARRILELEGAVVRLACNGQEAVDQLRNPEHVIDVVLMDVQMPVLDGFEATRRIRNGLGLVQLPIIALTAGITPGEHERAQVAGMNDVVAKPFDPQDLVRCIRKHIQGANRLTITPAKTPIEPHAWPQIEGIDDTDVRSRLGEDFALFSSFLKDLIDRFADLDEPPSGADLVPLLGRLHDLKGSAAKLGAKSLAHNAAQAEAACRVGEIDRVCEGIKQLTAQLKALQQAAAVTFEAMRAAAQDTTEVAGVDPMDSEKLATLVLQLTRSDMVALKSFKALSTLLRAQLSPEAFAALSQNIDNLQFDRAAQTLAVLLR